MALTEGRVGYMLLIGAREVGETVLAACPGPGDCWEVYDMTLDAGVKAGVSVAAEATAVAWVEGAWLVFKPGGEVLVRNWAPVCT